MRERLLAAEKVVSIRWRDGCLHLLDQRLLPLKQVWLRYDSSADVATAIRDMVVRGAPVIGIAAAFAVVLAARARLAQGADWRGALAADCQQLAAARPTAVNLFWALKRMAACLAAHDDAQALAALEQEALAILDSDREANLAMASLGAELIRKDNSQPQNIYTHCNAGALATGGFGTALGVIRAAHADGLVERVFVNETRPWLQGSRLTAWELLEEGVPTRLNVDSAAAFVMREHEVRWVIVGADRIANNGDVVNKIGTYQLAVTAMHHGARFMVVAPSSTIDMDSECGDDVEIEERSAEELLSFAGQRITVDMPTYNPSFDITPADLIDAIVTEKGVVERPDEEKMQALMCRKRLH
ncbi:S-methyl-5-thioribose-1-phosphate isomerase [Atopomonas sediminilitoris]|uniref:S-methyl-5-thioribose-1-phosphate isomerase n=1 Tax=Atopomonas sediminilitoris TaxID=2919919 RepID=UPI001F4DD972|nr:S-methyl-5-thioribose-1-phosphate isomerase [Atopomonas sediminilitoris]MCJ8169250.1 S-methyl-5-thioribose-1-phosphate isomerase [Atopomonas sediminilitoris]